MENTAQTTTSCSEGKKFFKDHNYKLTKYKYLPLDVEQIENSIYLVIKILNDGDIGNFNNALVLSLMLTNSLTNCLPAGLY